MKSPHQYKTQAGLLKALTKAHYLKMDVSLAWWFHNCKDTLINNFGWEEIRAQKYVAGYFPHESKYIAAGRG